MTSTSDQAVDIEWNTSAETACMAAHALYLAAAMDAHEAGEYEAETREQLVFIADSFLAGAKLVDPWRAKRVQHLVDQLREDGLL